MPTTWSVWISCLASAASCDGHGLVGQQILLDRVPVDAAVGVDALEVRVRHVRDVGEVGSGLLDRDRAEHDRRARRLLAVPQTALPGPPQHGPSLRSSRRCRSRRSSGATAATTIASGTRTRQPRYFLIWTSPLPSPVLPVVNSAPPPRRRPFRGAILMLRTGCMQTGAVEPSGGAQPGVRIGELCMQDSVRSRPHERWRRRGEARAQWRSHRRPATSQTMRALLRAARADPRAASSGTATACRSCRWSSGSASRARRCASRSRRSSTRACCARCPPAATWSASSPEPTSSTRSSCAACSRAPRRASPPSAAPDGASCARCARSTTRSPSVVQQADYESFERYVGLNDRFHAGARGAWRAARS